MPKWKIIYSKQVRTVKPFKLLKVSKVLAPPAALKRYRAKCNIQAEIEEMQEEQRSLSSVRTVSVWHLLLDSSVRWQVLSVVVINIGMQLSGIDAVRSPAWPERRGSGRAAVRRVDSRLERLFKDAVHLHSTLDTNIGKSFLCKW